MLDITQGSASGAIPPLKLRQDDVDQPFIYFRGTAANGNLDRSIVDDDDVTVGSRDGWIMVYVEDIGNQITDQKYFVPVYTLS